MALGIRFPKTLHFTWNSQDLDSGALGGDTYYVLQRRFGLPIAPRRYSEVRKVIFWVTGVSIHPTVQFDAELRILMGTDAADARTTPLVTAVPVQTHIEAALPASIFGAGAFTADKIFTRVGDTIAFPSNLQRGSAAFGGSVMATIEFDVFNATDQDFFTAWNAPEGEDEFIEFFFGLRDVGGSAPPSSSIRMTGFGITVVQAPSANNKTCTYLVAKSGREVSGSGQDDFNTLDAAEFRRHGSFRFRYDASEWTDIDRVHLHIMTGTAANTGAIDVRLVEITDDGARAVSTVFTETIPAPGANHQGIWRTQDFLSLLEDGKDYGFDYRQVGVAGGGSGSGDQMVHFEIIQKGQPSTEMRTVCYFEPRVQTTPATSGQPVAPVDQFEAAALFDPLWFANMPDERILSNIILGGFNHDTVTNDGELLIQADSDITLDTNQFVDGIAPTMAEILPHILNNPQLVDGWKYRELTITSTNPINLAGRRRLFYFTNLNWTDVSGDDRPGVLALKYGILVPAQETLDLAPVFDLNAFSPEGCVSTSAGLGDPGVLVITNGSTRPQKFNPAAGVVEDAGICPPFSGEIPTTQVNDSAVSPEGGLTPGLLYNYCYTLRNSCTGKESDPSPDLVQVDTSSASPAASVTLSFAGIRIPPDDQVDEICVYRSLGDVSSPSTVVKFKVGCFPVDLSPAVFIDTIGDSVLSQGDPLSFLNGPMPCVTSVAEFRNRLFGLGDIPQLSPAGTVSVAQDSQIITGSADVEWDCCLIGKLIQLEGDCRSYEITEVLPPVAGTSPAIQRLKILEPYEGTDVTGALYTICGHPSRLFYSEPLEPECWPAVNFLDVESGDGDRLVGLQSNFGRLVLCKRNKTYSLAFSETPAEVNVPIRVSSDIGCIGPRTFAQIEAGTVWLADRGLAIYDGRGVQHVPESVEINDLFVDEQNPRYVRRNRNGLVIDAVGVFYPKREQYLLLLPTVQTDRGANLMLVWDTKNRNVTLLEFCQEFQSMVVAKDDDGNERVYLGDTNGFVWLFDVGDTDGVGTPGATGTVVGAISDAGVDDNGVSFLEDSNASFIVGGLVAFGGLSGVPGLTPSFDGDVTGLAGVCLFVEDENGEFTQQTTVFAATNTTLFVTPSWGDNTPPVGRRYMIGPIKFDALFKPKNYGTDDVLKRNWRQILTHDVKPVASRLRVELLPDFALSDSEEATVQNESGEIGRLFSMDFSRGRQVRPVGRRIHNYMGVRLSNFAPEEPIAILNHALGVEGRQSK